MWRMSLQEFKCPNCGGAIGFDSGEQKLVCPYCDSIIDVEALKYLDESLGQEQESEAMSWAYEGEEWSGNEQEGMAVYSCRSCGAEIIGDETTGASICPFCDNPVVMTSKFSGSLRPDLVIPFKFNKEQALAALQNHYMNKKLLPKVFKDKNHLEEIKGVYVPFWLFDAATDANVVYDATSERMWSDSRYDYVETSHYRVFREGSMAFDHVPVDGSEAIDDTLMESIEPFSIEEAVDFQTAYLAGYFANKYDLDMEKCEERANHRIKNSVEDSFEETVTGYNSVGVIRSNVTFKSGEAHYALLPVWLLSTKWKDKSYSFAMNGQTGKFVGDLPMDKGLRNKWFAGIFGISAAVLSLISMIAVALI